MNFNESCRKNGMRFGPLHKEVEADGRHGLAREDRICKIIAVAREGGMFCNKLNCWALRGQVLSLEGEHTGRLGIRYMSGSGKAVKKVGKIMVHTAMTI